MAGPIVLFDRVHKSYRDVKAVDGVSFEVPSSVCFGLLGPNGAGKSTIMRLVHAHAKRDRTPPGRIEVFGFDPERRELDVKCRCGVVPQEDNLDDELDVEQNLLVYARLYGLAIPEARPRIRDLLAFMGLADKARSEIRELSGGMKRRLIIARALLNDPWLLVLDEPTTGLDPQVRHAIWDKLRQLKRGGLTILLSTHYMEEAFQLCDDVLIVDQGKAILQGHPKELVGQHIERYVLELTEATLAGEVIARVPRDSVRLDESGESVRLYADDYQLLRAATGGLPGTDFHLRESNLEDLFLRTTGRALNARQ
jgi:lipooligosaccharide transport system ATP-binding protein